MPNTTIIGEFGINHMEDLPPEVGGSIEWHEHDYDHITVITQGGLKCEVVMPEDGKVWRMNEKGRVVGKRKFVPEDDPSGDYYAGDIINIRAGIKHKFTALLPNSKGLCVYLHRDPKTGRPVREPNGFNKAYG